jgi:hypothetical protein
MGGRVRLCGGADKATLAKPTATAEYSPNRSVPLCPIAIALNLALVL